MNVVFSYVAGAQYLAWELVSSQCSQTMSGFHFWMACFKGKEAVCNLFQEA